MPGSFPKSPDRNSPKPAVRTLGQGSDDIASGRRGNETEYPKEEIQYLERTLFERGRQIDALLKDQGYYKGRLGSARERMRQEEKRLWNAEKVNERTAIELNNTKAEQMHQEERTSTTQQLWQVK